MLKYTCFSSWRQLLALTILFVLGSTSDAWAYIDPGTGSYLFQLLIAGGLAGMYTLRRYWHTVKATLSSMFGRASNDSQSRSHGVD